MLICGGVLGPGTWPDALCLPIEEGCEWGGECERGEDHVYEGCCFVMQPNGP
jgi:hypothetical protein